MRHILNKIYVNITYLYLITINHVLASASPFEAVDEKSGVITDWLTGSFATALGIIALVTVFVGMMFGKINLAFALVVIFSIIGIFTADTIVSFLNS